MGELIGLYVFGSVARGEGDERSDLDLLAVVADGAGKVPEEDIVRRLPAAFEGLDRSISWYGRNRIGEMFRNGELFAWHLSSETVPIFEREPFIASLGRPAPYTSVTADVASFEKILSGIPAQLTHAPDNAIYELGLVYVCLRNICMAASWVFCDRPDFSRYSPFLLRDVAPVPISRNDYDLAMACRMAGQRGMPMPTGVERSRVADIYAMLMPWIVALRHRLEES